MATALSPPPRTSPAVGYRLNGPLSRSPSSSVSPRRKAVPVFEGDPATFSKSGGGDELKTGQRSSPLQQGDVFSTVYTTPSTGLTTPPDGGMLPNVERSLPPTPNESPATIYSKDTRDPSALNLGAPISVIRHNSGSSAHSGQAKIPPTNQGVHYLRAARQKGSSISLASTGNGTGNALAALANGLPRSSEPSPTKAAFDGPDTVVEPPTAAEAAPPSAPSAPALTAKSSKRPASASSVAALFKSPLAPPKKDDFSVEALPSTMSLWEASHCRITDEHGRSRRFGDFWDDINARPDAEASRVLAHGAALRRAEEDRAEKEARRASTTSQLSVVSQASRASTADMTETSGYQSSRGDHSPSLRSLELTLDAGSGNGAPAPSSTESLAAVPLQIAPPSSSIGSRHSNGSTSTLREPISRKRSSGSQTSGVLAGGEEWIVMGRRTVVFFIRNFWCGQCQDYTLASLSILDPAAIHAAGINIVIISNGSWKILKKYRALFKCPFPIYVDTSRRLYQVMGMVKYSNDFGPAQGRAAYHQRPIPRQVLHGLSNAWFRMPLGNPGKLTQLGGEFIVGPGLRCEFAHRMTNTSNHTEAPEILKLAGVENPTLPEQQAVQVAQEELDNLAREQSELEEWREGRETELERIQRRKAERRGLRYEAALRNAGNRLSVPLEERWEDGDDSDGEVESPAVGASPSSFPSLTLPAGLHDDPLQEVQQVIRKVGTEEDLASVANGTKEVQA